MDTGVCVHAGALTNQVTEHTARRSKMMKANTQVAAQQARTAPSLLQVRVAAAVQQTKVADSTCGQPSRRLQRSRLCAAAAGMQRSVGATPARSALLHER